MSPSVIVLGFWLHNKTTSVSPNSFGLNTIGQCLCPMDIFYFIFVSLPSCLSTLDSVSPFPSALTFFIYVFSQFFLLFRKSFPQFYSAHFYVLFTTHMSFLLSNVLSEKKRMSEFFFWPSSFWNSNPSVTSRFNL